MNTRLIIVSSLILLAVGWSWPAAAAEKQGGSIEELFRAPLPDAPGTDVAVIRVNYAPGAATPPHEHPGFIYAYVLEGAVVSQVGDARPQTYHQGQMWSELPWQHHVVSKNVSSTAPASLLVFVIIPHRAPLTVALPSPAASKQSTTDDVAGTQ